MAHRLLNLDTHLLEGLIESPDVFDGPHAERQLLNDLGVAVPATDQDYFMVLFLDIRSQENHPVSVAVRLGEAQGLAIELGHRIQVFDEHSDVTETTDFAH